MHLTGKTIIQQTHDPSWLFKFFLSDCPQWEWPNISGSALEKRLNLIPAVFLWSFLSLSHSSCFHFYPQFIFDSYFLLSVSLIYFLAAPPHPVAPGESQPTVS